MLLMKIRVHNDRKLIKKNLHQLDNDVLQSHFLTYSLSIGKKNLLDFH